ncbi:MAG: DUF2141 domain-containing protein [Alteripontixanthobacter sp.]
MTDKFLPVFSLALATAGLALASPAQAQYRQKINHDPSRCDAGPAAMVTITDVKSSSGTIRVQSYRGTEADWLEKGKWINRIELPARAGTMRVCMPLPASGTYGIAVRHDVNGNGKTDLRADGGAMSNNPSLNIFNLGKPSYKKTRFDAGSGVTSLSIRMRYFG